ncbi:murein hydrolase activator EnvC family protein [Bacteroides mediterraneensis]|uniref:murein hydrolase activator EnvC family protein n=1 Tax=Bacteroides mediterraneensis TaxID=1841856 RepID=UPI001959FC9F|nr:peptidoglycan DD-metalloendopeptidase family protein [Bacteroides mediterraneensis]MBM6782339.1 peptidoglycan DD-metalloendopeptidase family protein [Bacteroides mediterraneensis]
MKRLIVIFCICLCMCTLSAQTTRKIRQLEKQRNELKQQIAESETLLQSTKKDVKSQLGNLVLISGQIEERQKYIQTIESDVNSIQQEINRLEKDLVRLQKELGEKRQKYEQSVKYLYRNKSIQDKLMFIFSAENFGQMYRRLRYVREYADYQRLQGIQVQRKQKQVTEKAISLKNSRKAKEDLLKQGEAEKAKLEAQEQERKQILSGLQKKQRSIQSELAKKRRSADKLNAQIDRLIEEEIEKARKRAEEEARRKAEEARKAAEAAKGASGTSAAKTETGKTPVEKLEAYKVDSEDRRLSSVFEKNKGILPVPITGPYVVVGHYGQYQVKGLRNVKLDNKGMDIKGKAGANARAIFDGEVSAVFQYNGLTNVLVRHGSYISVYCNLSTVRVKKGSLVRARDVLGEVHTNADGETILHFQLRKETVKLNPELWIHR